MPINPPMSASPALVPIVEEDEGFSPVITNDEGHPMIGFGCDLLPDEVEHYQAIQPISRDMGVELLLSRMVPVEHVVDHFVNWLTVSLNQNQFDALCDFVYNEGSGHFASSTLLKLLNQGDYQGAADQFLVWDVAGGKVEPGLLARRQQERALFLTPSQT